MSPSSASQKKKKIVVYGATGYTARLFIKTYLCRHPVDGPRTLILAGRTAEKVKAIATDFGCQEFRSFSVEDAVEQSFLGEVALLINLAGPFSETQSNLIPACLKYKCHYIDIAGEVDEIKAAHHAFHEEALKIGIQLTPGAGFGVVPTDLCAKAAVDDLIGRAKVPHKLIIAYATEGEASRGTLGTVLPAIHTPGYKTVDGELMHGIMPASATFDFQLAGKKFSSVYNPWRGDLFTASLSTRVDNIETYAVFPTFVVWMMKGWLLWLRYLLVKYLLPYLPEGPTDKQIAEGATYITATAETKDGTSSSTVTMKGPEAYQFTALSLEAIATQILNGNASKGFTTPSYYGKSLLDGMEKVEWNPQR